MQHIGSPFAYKLKSSSASENSISYYVKLFNGAVVVLIAPGRLKRGYQMIFYATFFKLGAFHVALCKAAIIRRRRLSSRR